MDGLYRMAEPPSSNPILSFPTAAKGAGGPLIDPESERETFRAAVKKNARLMR